jgi:hypothetical protein
VIYIHEYVLRKWGNDFIADPAHALPGPGQQKPEQAEAAGRVTGPASKTLFAA